jgi:hypothetical protein
METGEQCQSPVVAVTHTAAALICCHGSGDSSWLEWLSKN